MAAEGGAVRVRQAQLLMPLLEVLEEQQGGVTASAAVEAVAAKVGVPDGDRDARAFVPGAGMVRLFARDVRWARQRAKLAGQVDGEVRNLWRLTPRGRRDLRLARPGIVITIFETELGCALWGQAEAAVGHLEDESVNLWLTSPPYDLARQKDYGGRSGGEYLDWLTGLCREMHRTLTADGSLVLNLGDAWTSGAPVVNLYQERLLLRLCDDLGFRLAQRLVWHNPAKLPAPAEWVTVRRCRVTPATETLFWLSKSDFPKADNRKVLRPYSESMRRLLAKGGERGARRPSGHTLAPGAFGADCGGSVPHNLISASHTGSQDAYQAYCRGRGLPIHPARFPAAVAEFPIRLLTEEGDLVGDPFAGSCTTGEVAERLGRRWLAVEQSLTYLQGAVARFPGATQRAAG